MVIQTPRIPTERTSSKKNKKEKVQPRSFIIYLHWPIKVFITEHFTLQTNTEITIHHWSNLVCLTLADSAESIRVKKTKMTKTKDGNLETLQFWKKILCNWDIIQTISNLCELTIETQFSKHRTQTRTKTKREEKNKFVTPGSFTGFWVLFITTSLVHSLSKNPGPKSIHAEKSKLKTFLQFIANACHFRSISSSQNESQQNKTLYSCINKTQMKVNQT